MLFITEEFFPSYLNCRHQLICSSQPSQNSKKHRRKLSSFSHIFRLTFTFLSNPTWASGVFQRFTAVSSDFLLLGGARFVFRLNIVSSIWNAETAVTVHKPPPTPATWVFKTNEPSVAGARKHYKTDWSRFHGAFRGWNVPINNKVRRGPRSS